jgi:RNA polymerase sigma factor (TIGR02999 family)
VQESAVDRAANSEVGEVTRLLRAARAGEPEALDRLVPLIYEDLRTLARRQLRREHGERTMHPTSLVHEAFMKLGGSALHAQDRPHLLSIAARLMRQVLVDNARRRSAAKRRSWLERASLDDQDIALDLDVGELLALDDALAALEPRQRQVVECRFFGGMDDREIAAALGVTERTVRRDWVKARAWLYQMLYGPSPG